MDETPKLIFTTRVLGAEAVQALEGGDVTQTVRSRKQAAPFLMSRGKYVTVYLDGVELYEVRITDIIETKLSNLTMLDAQLGGFIDVGELENAMKRAGFRFKPLYWYTGFKIQFKVK